MCCVALFPSSGPGAGGVPRGAEAAAAAQVGGGGHDARPGRRPARPLQGLREVLRAGKKGTENEVLCEGRKKGAKNRRRLV